VAGLTEAEAKAKVEAAGCRLGDVTPGPDKPDQSGKVVDQGPTGGTEVPRGTEVNLTVAGPACTVPPLSGLSEADARSKVEAEGCVLTTDQRVTTNPDDVGKVLDQSPAAAMVVAKGSPVNATLGVPGAAKAAAANSGVTLAGQTATRQPTSPIPTLAATGGVALAGLALWLMISGLMAQVAGSKRLWRLARRREG
jgi:serine/threonine-protein kinase